MLIGSFYSRLLLFIVVAYFNLANCFDYRDVLPKNKYHHWYQSNSEYFATLVNTPFSPAASHANTYLYQMYGVSSSAVIDVEVKQACRLNMKPCESNNDCCSGFCICNRWNSMGYELCWRRCL